jgi:hypothetical protein
MSDWGKGSENNNIGWGQAAGSATNDWGKSQKNSYAGQTDIVGLIALSISYSSNNYCDDSGNTPQPTVSNNAGAGTFSSTAGLVIDSSTGVINTTTSTVGSYLITYTDTDAATATATVVILNLDNASFAYSASSYAPTDADPTPTITGLTGGTFSGTTGLVIDSSTGVIDLSASTVAAHTITYNTTSSGSSVCPNTSTQNVDIALAGIANNYSMNFDYTSGDYINAGSSLDVTGSITFSAWINISSATTGGNILFSSGTTSGNHIQIGYNRGGYEGRILVSTTASYWDTDNSVMSSVLSLNTWYHLVVTKVWDGSDNVNNIYINGSLDSSTPSIGNYWGANTTTNTLIGVGGSSFLQYKYFDGKLDEVAIWNTNLSSTQIQSIYDATSTNLTKDLTTVSGSNLKYWNRMGD